MSRLGLVLLLALCANGENSSGHNGLRKLSKYGKIVGGEETTIQKRPFQVLLYLNKADGTYLCGGSIINNKTILTAAHCLPGVTSINVRSGSSNLNSGGVLTTSSQFTPHPRYNPATSDYDVAIVKLPTALKLDGVTMKAVPLASTTQTVPGGSPVTVSGWGTTSEDGDISNVLMKVTVPVVNNTRCQQLNGPSIPITSRMLCAGEPTGGKDSCQGDSGGPLTNANGVQVGIVSFGVGCARAEYPGVYARVSALRTFINSLS